MAYSGLWPTWAYGLSDLESLGSMTFCFSLLYSHSLFVVLVLMHTAFAFTLGPSFTHAYPSFTHCLSFRLFYLDKKRGEEKRRDEARREEKSVACDNGLMTFLLLSLLQSGPPDNVFV